MKPTNFYEVMDRKGDISWGGASESEAIAWFRRGLDNSLFVSVWDESDPEEPVMVEGKIDISKIVLTAFTEGRG